MKICSTCKSEKDFNDFSKDKKRKDGFYPQCKLCKKLYYTSNRERLLEKKREYHQLNKGSISKYCTNNSDKRNAANKAWRENNKAHIKQYKHDRLAKNLNLRIAHNLRSRLRSAIKTESKIGSAINELGCSIEYFKNFIEIQFLPGMSWENYGKGHGKWSLDHIIPLSKMDLSNIDKFKEACHYTNLRPLWAVDNSKRGNRT